MLPVVASPAVVARKILFYSYVMVAVTLALAPYAGWLYTAAAVVLGGWFLAEAHRLHHRVAAMPDARGTSAAGTGPAHQASPAAAGDASPGPGSGPLMTVMDVVITVDVVTGVPAAGGTGVTGGACAGLAPPSANPAPMRLFHLSIAYLTLLFAVIAVTALLPWGSW
jgi:heme O synthase-like polyprenyltransferase